MRRVRRGATRLLTTVALLAVIALAAVAIYVEIAPSGKPSSSSARTTSSTSGASTSTAYSPVVVLSPPAALLQPGQTQNYTTIDVNPPFTGTLSGTMTLKVFAPPGITITLNESSVDLANAPLTVPYTVSADLGVAPGTYHAVVETSSGGRSENQTLDVDVVQYLVTMLDLAFHPLNLSVPVGANVTWMNLDGMIGCCDPGIHNVDFTATLGFVSPNLSRFQTFSYVFSTPGTFYYYCSIHPFMIAEVVVTPTSG